MAEDAPAQDAKEPSPAAEPQPHDDGGATLKPAATPAEPVLLASIEVYQNADGVFLTNLTQGGTTHPQHSAEYVNEVIDAVSSFLTEQLAA